MDKTKVNSEIISSGEQNQEKKNMETHAHHLHKAPGNRFWHYFYEFLMLFLAVFCGFLAENFREHQIEHQREKQYMNTLLEDLKGDTMQMMRLKTRFQRMVKRGDSIRMYLKPPIQPDKVLQYYREAVFIISMYGYAYNDRTIEQLRQSGNFRLIRKRDVTDSLITYDNRMRNTFAKNYDVLWAHRLKLNNDLDAIIDGGALEYLLPGGIVSEDSLRKNNLGPLRLITNDPNILMNFYNAALLQRAYIRDFINWTDRMRLSADNLILLIQKEYHLE